MAEEQNKTDSQIKKEEEQRKEYVALTGRYKSLSLKFLKASALCAILLFLYMIIIRIAHVNFLTGAEYFFLFISLIAFCISIALHWQYQKLSHDTLSEFSENISVFAKNKDLNKRISRNRKTVYNNNIPFWIGIFSLILVILIWVISPMENNDTDKQPSQNKKSDGKITIDLLQINDVYEISPLDSDRIGGMSRIAALKKQFLKQNENTMLIMAGDFLSPSVFNSVKLNGERVAGKQMIAAMNTAGVDLTIFGNHEFDVSYDVLQKRINESSFQWIASNVYHKAASGNIRFQKNKTAILPSYTKTFINSEGTPFTIGFFGLTLPDNKGGDPEYAFYDSTLSTAKKMYAELSPKCDAVIAVTHQDLKEDSILAAQIPQLAAIMGGHEHDMQFGKVGNVYITKAHSNAKSAFHSKLIINRNSEPKLTIIPELIPVDSSIQQDYLTKTITERWMDIAMAYFRSAGFAPHDEVCANFKANLDGRDAEVRSKQTNLTKLITDAMLEAGKTKGCTIAMLNSGSIRVDDMITPPITEYSFLRALPYEGKIYVAEMQGWFIKKVFTSASHLINEGAFLQYSIDAKINITDSSFYRVAIGDYLISGKQSKLEFLKSGTKGIVSVDSTAALTESNFSDMRKAVISYLRNNCNNKSFLKKYQ